MRDTTLRIDADALRLLISQTHINILLELSLGKSLTQVGKGMGCSQQNIAAHLYYARKRSGCKTNSQLMAVVVRAGILEGMWERLRMQNVKSLSMKGPKRERRELQNMRDRVVAGVKSASAASM